MMKKLLLLSIILMASLSSLAANYFTIGENDTLRISPNCIGDVVTIPVRLHLDGRIDSWSLTLTYPNALDPGLVLKGAAMSIPYIKSDGTDDIYQAVITDANTFTTLSSIITDFGYWDYNNDGIVDINDVTALIAIVNGTNGIEDPSSPQGDGGDDLEE